MVLPPPYKYPERRCHLRKAGLDTRLFTSSHTMELLRYRGIGPLLDPLRLLRLELRDWGSFRRLGISLRSGPTGGPLLVIICISSI